MHADTARGPQSGQMVRGADLLCLLGLSDLSRPAATKLRKKVTLRSLQHMFMTGTPISMLTAYDFHSAR